MFRWPGFGIATFAFFFLMVSSTGNQWGPGDAQRNFGFWALLNSLSEFFLFSFSIFCLSLKKALTICLLSSTIIPVVLIYLAGKGFVQKPNIL